MSAWQDCQTYAETQRLGTESTVVIADEYLELAPLFPPVQTLRQASPPRGR